MSIDNINSEMQVNKIQINDTLEDLLKIKFVIFLFIYLDTYVYFPYLYREWYGKDIYTGFYIPINLEFNKGFPFKEILFLKYNIKSKIKYCLL
jgi:hypothetical protein